MLRMLVTAVPLALAVSVSVGAEDEACRVIQNEVETTAVRSLASGGPARLLGTMCGYENVMCDDSPNQISLDSIEKRGIRLEAAGLRHILKERANIEVSEIDINNDESPDVRLTTVVGSAGCQKNYFFIHGADNTYAHKQFREFDPLTTEGGFCHDDALIVRRVKDRNYLVAVSTRTVVFRGTPDGALMEICSFATQERWTKEQTEIADLVRQKYPNWPAEVELARPELERIDFDNHEPFAKKGEMVWTVVARCKYARYAYAIVLVHPNSRGFEVVIEPGGSGSRCD